MEAQHIRWVGSHRLRYRGPGVALSYHVIHYWILHWALSQQSWSSSCKESFNRFDVDCLWASFLQWLSFWAVAPSQGLMSVIGSQFTPWHEIVYLSLCDHFLHPVCAFIILLASLVICWHPWWYVDITGGVWTLLVMYRVKLPNLASGRHLQHQFQEIEYP